MFYGVDIDVYIFSYFISFIVLLFFSTIDGE